MAWNHDALRDKRNKMCSKSSTLLNNQILRANLHLPELFVETCPSEDELPETDRKEIKNQLCW